MMHKDRSVIVTGSARGLGVEIARRFAREGANVMLNDKNDDAIDDVIAALSKEGPGETCFVKADLSNQEGAEAVMNGTIEAWGKIDILVNNAGGGHIRPFLSHDAESLKETLERNLWSCLWCCHTILPHMVERNYGRIVNVGAESVRNGLDAHAGYNAAKGGMNGLTTGLAREFGSYDITINTVSPGGLLTPEIKEMLNPDSDVYAKHEMPVDINKYTETIPKGRFAEMEEVASMINYIASDEARFVTGQIIGVNGGNTMY